jgi:hypothetical protein
MVYKDLSLIGNQIGQKLTDFGLSPKIK